MATEGAAKRPAVRPVQPEEETLIKHRLLIGSTVMRGEAPALRLAHAYARLCRALDTGTLEEAEEEHRGVLQELCKYEQLAKKQGVVRRAVQSDRRFLEGQQTAAAAAAAAARTDIERAKQELKVARLQQRQAEECEVVRRDVASAPSRPATAAECERVEADIARLTREREHLEALLQVRRKQCGAVLHAIQDLRSTLEEEEPALTAPPLA